MKRLLPLIVFSLFFNFSASSQATTPFTTCPDVNIGLVRAGTNNDEQNPYYIYSINTTTGAVTQNAGGPLRNPANPAQNLQVNGVGINTTDGYMYGMTTEAPGTNPKFIRFDYNYGVTVFGGIAPPTSPSGFLGFVNTAAGDIDRSNNYYFTGFTVNPAANNTYTFDKLFLGKISGISTLAGVPAPEYFEIDLSDVNCTNYIASLTSDPINSGIKDITFNPATNTFFIYATYKPTGAANFSGQLIELKPVANSSPLKYKMFCNATVNSHFAETAGTLIDNSGNFLVLLTDGTIGKMQSAGGFNYTGVYTALNNATGLPNPLRGDFASCGSAVGGPTPITLSSFKASTRDCKTNFSWSSQTESNLSHYELQQSFDNTNFTSVGTINANNRSNSTYGFTLSSAGSLAFYRLKVVDADRKYSYSDIVAIKNACVSPGHGFTIKTNPVTDVIKMNWYGMNAATMNVKVYNSFGVLVLTQNQVVPAGSSLLNINAARLAPGVYVIKAFNPSTNETMQSRFVKQ